VQIETLEKQYGREFVMKYRSTPYGATCKCHLRSCSQISAQTPAAATIQRALRARSLVIRSKVINWFEGQNTQHQLGFFPLLAKRDLADGGLSSSFVERDNSAAERIMGNGRTGLHEDELGKLVVLRINREFIKFLRTALPIDLGSHY
jgi:hypothetical protein